jgi:hypothetical protein
MTLTSTTCSTGTNLSLLSQHWWSEGMHRALVASENWLIHHGHEVGSNLSIQLKNKCNKKACTRPSYVSATLRSKTYLQFACPLKMATKNRYHRRPPELNMRYIVVVTQTEKYGKNENRNPQAAVCLVNTTGRG